MSTSGLVVELDVVLVVVAVGDAELVLLAGVMVHDQLGLTACIHRRSYSTYLGVFLCATLCFQNFQTSEERLRENS